MKYTRNIFAVSLIALMSVATARAEVVSTELLNKRLGTEGNLAAVAASGSYTDLADKPTIPTVNNATLTIQKNGTNVDTFTANASANKTINITVPTNTNELTNGAGFITSAAISGKQDVSNMATGEYESGSTTQYPSIKVAESIAKTAAGASMLSIGDLGYKNAVETDDIVDGAVTSAKIANGTITTTDISATAGITKAQLATAVQTSLGLADSALQAVPVATTTAVGGVKSGGNITVATDGAVTVNQAAKATTADSATSATSATKATQDASGNVITTTYATKTELTDGLAGKQASLGYTAENAANKVTAIASTSTDTQYPSAKAVYTELAKKQNTLTIDSALSSTSTNPVQNKVVNTALAGKQDTLKAGTNITIADDGTISATDTNTTYTTGTASTAGLTKLYTGTGTNTDGTMTQAAINTALNAKQSTTTAVTHTASAAAGSATVPVYVSSTGVATAITSYSGNAATATTATNAKKICSGSACTSFVDIWVE